MKKIIAVLIKVVHVLGLLADAAALVSPRYHKLAKDFKVLSGAVHTAEKKTGQSNTTRVMLEVADKLGIKDRLIKRVSESIPWLGKTLDKLEKKGIKINLPF